MLLPMLQWDKEGVQAATSEFPAHHYTSRQCTALETMLEILRDFFAEGGQVQIKPATLDRGITQLKGIICLYRQTTDMIISDYIADSNQRLQNTDASCGEVSMEIDAYHHPATGELEGTIRGMNVLF
ncbi:Phorbol ester/diacylglycerol-binding protein unc-13 [Geodia barretti]|uniref:Phorbol ester/diacylglycerol-binding protein unc-13 n=1 Tax=Geodia barretti TaxID=519541 RepID=A0AA35TTB8_GEOBA|nr:Phorbol ester/diacylglycerol-binding protein unc-13 [Geodia barretti]